MSLFLFSDDAEVQRQKVVPVLIGDATQPSTSSFPPPVQRLSVRRSLQAFFTGTAGIFSPGTMLNSDLASVLGWSQGADGGENHLGGSGTKASIFMSSSLCPSQPWLGPDCPSLTFAKTSLLRVHLGAGERKKKDKYTHVNKHKKMETPPTS